MISGEMVVGVAGVTGLEPATFCVTGRRSNQLSYAPNIQFFLSATPSGTRGEIRTRDPGLMSPVL